jgi:Trk K+ transport system NAD-binding subunit
VQSRGLTRPIVTGRRFVLHGLGRVTARVATLLGAEGAEVVVVAPERDRDLAGLLDGATNVIWEGPDPDRALEEAGLRGAQAFLVLGADDLQNLRAVVSASGLAPAVPIVLRIFNPVLAEQFESRLNIRRAYSVSALSAPAFVAAALGERFVETVHLGDQEVALCTVRVNPGSPLAGESADDLERDFDLSLLARSAGTTWGPVRGGDRVAEGDRILVGGPMRDVLRLAVRDHTLFGPRGRMRRALRRGPRRPRRRGATLLPRAAAALGALLVLAGAVFALTQGLPPIEAAYFTITTAFGEQTLIEESAALKVLGILTAVGGGALAAVVFSHLASVATAERLEQRAGRRAARLSGHVIVAGLGTIGYRVVRLLVDLDIPVVAVERSADSRFRDALGELAPVLTGDVRVPESLEPAGIDRAAVLLAATDDDLANVLACLHARHASPEVRTVARIYDETLAERVSGTFGIDRALSTSRAAAGAFASAATDERAARAFDLGGAPSLVLRHDVVGDLTPAEVRAWEERGVHLLAFRRGRGAALPPSALDQPLGPGDSAIMAGPEEVIRRLLLAEG